MLFFNWQLKNHVDFFAFYPLSMNLKSMYYLKIELVQRKNHTSLLKGILTFIKNFLTLILIY